MAGTNRSTGRLSYDTVFTILSNPRRRYVLQYLQENGGEGELRDVSEHLAAWENEKTVETITRQERRRVYTALQQVHLPRMDEDGVVDFDRDRGTVEMTDRAEELRVYLEVVQGSEIPWSEYYLGLSAVSVALVVAAYFGLLPVAVPNIAIAAAIAVLFAISAGVNVYRQRRRKVDFRSEAGEDGATDDDGTDAGSIQEADAEEGDEETGDATGAGGAESPEIES